MRTSATCPTPDHRATVCPAREGGFTLLEMLVALSLLALAAALAFPRAYNSFQTWQLASQRDDIVQQVSALGLRARQQGRKIRLGHYPADGAEDVLDLPPGWSLAAEPTLLFNVNGSCSGATVLLRHGQREWSIELSPPFCSP